MINIGLYYNNSSYRGPGKVVTNLLKGFAQLEEDIQVISNPDQRSLYDIQYTGLLQPIIDSAKYEILPEKTLIGPNVFVVPSEMEGLCSKHKNFIVPTEWVKRIYRDYRCLDHATLNVWSVGIDTDHWIPYVELPQEEQVKNLFDPGSTLDCFVYYKNRSPEDLNAVRALLNKFKLKYEIVEYGNYQEEQLKSLCYRSKFCVVLDNTESQGIALMEIMSTNCPLYVFDFPKWTAPDSNKVYGASSVPYFKVGVDGEKTLKVDEIHFKQFVSNLKNYSPRQSIVEKYSLKQSSKRYLNLLQLTGGKI